MTGAAVKQQQQNRNDGPGGKGQGGPKDKAGAGQHHTARQKAATLSVGQLADLPATASKHQVRAAPCRGPAAAPGRSAATTPEPMPRDPC